MSQQGLHASLKLVMDSSPTIRFSSDIATELLDVGTHAFDFVPDTIEDLPTWPPPISIIERNIAMMTDETPSAKSRRHLSLFVVPPAGAREDALKDFVLLALLCALTILVVVASVAA